ncbi:hypothetical protein F0562_032361 [Nyssa sinensis]|uniref:cyclin-dependent kinase n=1 Tax=Nyssa sinensis TaxID=561372 RepID=A0A5J5APZ7_9ASTE|nr:hypothetical protein F0562_032361 [Nyssa sinensis]
MFWQYDHIGFIGDGGFGWVYKARDNVTGEIVAIKVIFLRDADETVPSSVIREVSLLKELKHENIIRLLDILGGKRHVSLVFECMDCDLRKFMQTFPSAAKDPEIIKSFLHQILCGVECCHSYKIIHRDLKPPNLLIDTRNNIVKIADFGLARDIDVPLKAYTNMEATRRYMAPEMLFDSGQYSTPADVWSVGCIFAEMVNHRHIFPGDCVASQLHEIFRIMGTPNEEIWPGVTSVYPSIDSIDKFLPQDLAKEVPSLEPDGVDLLSKMLQLDPSKRITARDARRHAYFRDA